ncbi:MAG: amidohydrolase family protein [Candidatus Hydrogenedentes bacterium]|nr:amidohydrolase family protein [Candidatus Hydrogenedentota bacterium]
MIIDCHNHPDWWGHDIHKYLDNMKQHHIDVTWLLSWIAPRGDFDPNYFKHTPHPGADGPIPFARCLAYVEQQPEKFVLGYAPDPRQPEAIDLLAGAIEVYGVRVYGELKLRMCYDNPDALRMFRFCGEKKLPVTVHIDYEFDTGQKYPRPNWWYGGGFDAFARAVRACPETTFLGHAPGFWAHLSGDDQYDKEPYPKGPIAPGGKVLELLRQCPNLHCDISAGSGATALERDKAFTIDFLTEFQDRVLYGRDWFDNRHQELLDSIGLPASVLDKIYYENALRLVPLKSEIEAP